MKSLHWVRLSTPTAWSVTRISAQHTRASLCFDPKKIQTTAAMLGLHYGMIGISVVLAVCYRAPIWLKLGPR